MEAFKGDILTKEEMQMRGVKLITTDRGGVELRVRDAENTIALRLVEIGFIEESHFRDANVFMDLRRAYEASLGIKWGHIKTELDSGLSAGEAAKRYDDLRHEIGVKRAGAILTAVADAMLSPYFPMPAVAMNVYREYFEITSKAMQAKKRQYEKENG